MKGWFRRSRGRWIIGVPLAAALLFYIGAYLILRLDHTFVHRAGDYGFDSRRGVEIDTNHYIEPAEVSAVGESGFKDALMAAMESDPSAKLTEEEIMERVWNELGARHEKAQQRREVVFASFKPLVLLETLIWQRIDPDPLAGAPLLSPTCEASDE